MSCPGVTIDFDPPRPAWYSAEQAKISGTSIYRTVDGSEVEVTEVSDEDSRAPFCERSDAVRLLDVLRYIRHGQSGECVLEPVWVSPPCRERLW